MQNISHFIVLQSFLITITKWNYTRALVSSVTPLTLLSFVLKIIQRHSNWVVSAGSALAVEMSIRNERHAELTFSVTTKSLNRRTRKRNELHEHFL